MYILETAGGSAVEKMVQVEEDRDVGIGIVGIGISSSEHEFPDPRESLPTCYHNADYFSATSLSDRCFSDTSFKSATPVL